MIKFNAKLPQKSQNFPKVLATPMVILLDWMWFSYVIP